MPVSRSNWSFSNDTVSILIQTLCRAMAVGRWILSLSGYSYPFRKTNPKHANVREEPERLEAFEPGTCCMDIASLYEFDRKPRTLIHDGIERV
ncbi:hypothetical protein CRD60_06595 [Bifidobacterium aemilianum]|uniref:Uncharacterized protein n=1 Tax=Bifidobacterium aemilianum TaxID=2493120 RepID=A0A366K6S1_9BIFI|nr:hypothetical protein CRD60_06595 [Bifidobacterium aemilianum]